MDRRTVDVPAAVRADAEALEVLRMWVSGGHQYVGIANAFTDPATWGILLADLVRHAANANGIDADPERTIFIASAREAFLAELETPTGEPWGDVERPGG